MEKKKAAGRTCVQRTESAALPTARPIIGANDPTVRGFDECVSMNAEMRICGPPLAGRPPRARFTPPTYTPAPGLSVDIP
jgi:hypothetical protein